MERHHLFFRGKFQRQSVKRQNIEVYQQRKIQANEPSGDRPRDIKINCRAFLQVKKKQ